MKKLIAYLIAIAVIIYAGKTLFSAINCGGNSKRNTEISIKDNSVDTENTEEEKPKKPLFTASENDATVGLGEEIDSDYVISMITDYLKTGDGGPATGRNYSKLTWSYFVFQQWYQHYM